MKIFITGVSSGIGRELAKELIRHGHEVWGVARRKELLERLANELGPVLFFNNVCDVSDKNQVESVVENMRQKNFIPDVMILNAAVFKEDISDTYNHKIFEEAVKINLFGSLIWVGAFLGDFIKRGSGQFIAVSSTSALRPDVARSSYSASKAALSMAFRSFSLRYKRVGVFFKVIYFGPVATDMSVHVKRDSFGNIISKKFFVADPIYAARAIVQAIKGDKTEYYYPYFVTLLFRLLNFLPDNFFAAISGALRK